MHCFNCGHVIRKRDGHFYYNRLICKECLRWTRKGLKKNAILNDIKKNIFKWRNDYGI
jgi:hypothetical protein